MGRDILAYAARACQAESGRFWKKKNNFRKSFTGKDLHRRGRLRLRKSLPAKGLRQSSPQNPCHTPRAKSGHIRQIITNRNRISIIRPNCKKRWISNPWSRWWSRRNPPRYSPHTTPPRAGFQKTSLPAGHPAGMLVGNSCYAPILFAGCDLTTTVPRRFQSPCRTLPVLGFSSMTIMRPLAGRVCLTTSPLDIMVPITRSRVWTFMMILSESGVVVMLLLSSIGVTR